MLKRFGIALAPLLFATAVFAASPVELSDPVTPTQRAAVNTDGSVKIDPNEYPATSAALTAASGNVANASAAATLAGAAAKTTYICGFVITSAGSTAAAVVSPTITGTISGTLTFSYATVAGATLQNATLSIAFPRCIPASATNTAVVVTLPALGAGNTNATVIAWGYRL
jgi:hypothetical protein